jgi:hypothetical protein
MKQIVPSLTTYNKKISTLGAAATLSRKVTVTTAAATYTLPSSKGKKKEFTIVSTSGTATFGVTAPDTLVGLATVAVNTSGTCKAVGGIWYRTAT